MNGPRSPNHVQREHTVIADVRADVQKSSSWLKGGIQRLKYCLIKRLISKNAPAYRRPEINKHMPTIRDTPLDRPRPMSRNRQPQFAQRPQHPHTNASLDIDHN